jgi:P2 family phage major capsid protein
LDIITIGFNGVANTAATTDPTTYPLLQDVNIGWLQKLRVEAPSQVMSDGGDTTTGFTTKVTYGTADTADYKNLDALVWDARNTLLPVHARNDSELVVVVSDDLLHDKYFPIINSNDDAENQLARDIIMSTKRLGGLQPVTVHNFPAGTIWITKLSTLSLYRESGSARRHILDNPKRDRIEDYQSSNDAYVIEDLDFNCLVENIAQHDAA